MGKLYITYICHIKKKNNFHQFSWTLSTPFYKTASEPSLKKASPASCKDREWRGCKQLKPQECRTQSADWQRQEGGMCILALGMKILLLLPSLCRQWNHWAISFWLKCYEVLVLLGSPLGLCLSEEVNAEIFNTRSIVIQKVYSDFVGQFFWTITIQRKTAVPNLPTLSRTTFKHLTGHSCWQQSVYNYHRLEPNTVYT